MTPIDVPRWRGERTCWVWSASAVVLAAGLVLGYSETPLWAIWTTPMATWHIPPLGPRSLVYRGRTGPWEVIDVVNRIGAEWQYVAYRGNHPPLLTNLTYRIGWGRLPAWHAERAVSDGPGYPQEFTRIPGSQPVFL